MKTSRQLLLVAFLITIGALCMYDFTLKKVYDKGEFRNRFYGMEQVMLKNFNQVLLNGANFINAQIEYGPKYGVWATKDYQDKISFSEKDRSLIVDVIDKDKTINARASIVITCPDLQQLSTKAYFKDKKEEETLNRFPYATVKLSGFNHAKMSLDIGPSTKVKLDKNQIEILDALVGDNKIAYSSLIINATNKINLANIKVPGKSSLEIINPQIARSTYSFGDSASVTLNGKSLRLIK